MTPKQALTDALFLAIIAPDEERAAAAINLASKIAASCTKRQIADAKRAAAARAQAERE